MTQNVDDLLERAGATVVHHLHGTLTEDRCHGQCGFRRRIEMAGHVRREPCPECGESMRPGVVWFGESLPPAVWLEAEQACAGCDVLLVVGTSGEVYPAAGLVDLARSSGAMIVVVNTQQQDGPKEDLCIEAPASEVLPALIGSA